MAISRRRSKVKSPIPPDTPRLTLLQWKPEHSKAPEDRKRGQLGRAVCMSLPRPQHSDAPVPSALQLVWQGALQHRSVFIDALLAIFKTIKPSWFDCFAYKT
jgi:hypothetical protein